MRLHRLSNVTINGGKDSIDSVKRMKTACRDDRTRGMELLQEAMRYYSAMYRFREDRDRNKRYNYGDQWGDMVDVDGRRMTEEQYIKEQGNIPLKTNLIRRLVRSVLGVYRSQSTEPTCIARDRSEQEDAETMSTVLQYNMQLNRMNEMYARSLEEYLISGLVVHKKWYGWRNDRMDCWTDYVQSNNLILDCNMRDFRAWDCSFVGEIHDVRFETLCEQFATSPDEYALLAQIYKEARDLGNKTLAWSDFGFRKESLNMDFLMPTDHSRCRVIEVWRKESKARYRCHDYNNGDIFKVDEKDYDLMVAAENARRIADGVSLGMPVEDIPLIQAEWFVDSCWYYYYITPFGDILKEGETPYAHKGHPYVFKAYPFIDGEIHSFVSDVIDQQRYTNRLITLNDWIIRASAKGVLLLPEDCIPTGMSIETFAEEWTKFNGTIVFKPSKSGHVPQQVANNATNIGLHDMLAMQLKFFEDISGVQGALQGKPGFSGMSGTLYAQQMQNSSTSLLDILESFNEFVRDASYKDVKNIQQFYDQKRVVNIAGRSGSHTVYDPDKIRDVEFDLSIVPSQTTPAYRAVANDFLMALFERQAISVEQLLEAGNFPFSDELLQSIRVQKEQMQQGQTPQGISPELMQQVQEGANPQVQQMLGNA